MARPLTLKNERELLNVRALPIERYENEQLAALTVYSLHWLREWGLRPTVEAITVLNHRLFPSRFGMDFFPDFPDANRTLRSLLQCRPKYRGWVSGTNKGGFALTPQGHALVLELLRRIGSPQVGNIGLGEATEAPRKQRGVRKTIARDVDFKAEIAELRASRLFARWSEGPLQDRDLIHVYSAFGVFDHTPPAAKRQKLRDLRDSAQKAGDQDAERLLASVEETFPGLFTETTARRQR
ncbi:MAG TPA: hypothetical protein VFA33_04950 [Bryobacteraceae bacterium]|nr:hypothetical protein [Bryobacteraceae bacterium]